MKKRLFVVGNGPLPEDLSARVDASDHVIRFNEPKASIGMSGTKTDWLFLNNTGKPMQRRLADPAYPVSPIVRAADLVFFVYHPRIIRQHVMKPNILSRLKGRRHPLLGLLRTCLRRNRRHRRHAVVHFSEHRLFRHPLRARTHACGKLGCGNLRLLVAGLEASRLGRRARMGRTQGRRAADPLLAGRRGSQGHRERKTRWITV
jgi:hypothetical protein